MTPPPAAPRPPALQARDLSHGFGDRPVLRGVSLEVWPGEVVAVTGPSGSGKSTLLHLLGGLDQPDEGEVCWGGQSLAGLDNESRARWRAASVGFVFQHHYLLEDLTLAENLTVPLLLAGQGASSQGPAGQGLAGQAVDGLLDAVGLGGRGGELPGVLSGGERQRLAIARALAARPRVLLADEPTGSLDQSNARQAAGLLFALARERQTGVLLVTHDESLSVQADRRLHLVDGVLGA